MNNLQSQIDELEKRIESLENKVNNTSFAAAAMGRKTSARKALTSRENKIRSLAAGKNPGGRPRSKNV